ncbi:MAG TPA: FAD-dependent oxidoreductase [Gaiellaceae bacterium]|nr:FAD-dependent oxidoreductase [Gaiellaceae bacterium]
MSVSFWFEQLGGMPDPRPPLEGRVEADVCVVGGGYTGLWTAYELRRADPSLEVVVLEREVAGFGASGRNGGWVLGVVSGSRAGWTERGGRDGALALERAIHATVDEVGAVVDAEGIDCDFVKGGTLVSAQSDLELERLRAQHAEDLEFGLGEEDSVLLDAAALAERVRVQRGVGGLFSPHCGRVQPAKLVRGLAEVAERRGATIYEQTPVLGIEPGRAWSSGGEVRARWIVRATEAYTANLPGLRRVLAPVNSAMIATEPLPAAAWQEIGWDACETMLDGRRLYTYLQRTADGRIALGGRGVPYLYGSQTAREEAPPADTIEGLRQRLLDLFGPAADVGVAGAWQGVLGVSRTWRPAVGIDSARGLAWAGGYAGDGVAASNLAARTLRDLLLGADTELTRLPWVGPPERSWEPEPLRYAGIHAVHKLLRAADRAERRTGKPSRLGDVAVTISGRGH